MKRKITIFILIIITLILIAFLAFKVVNFNKNVEEYRNVNEQYEEYASLKEDNGKIVPEFQYINKNTKTVIIKKAKIVVYNKDTKEIILQKDLVINKKVNPSKKTTIKFDKIDKSVEQIPNYSIEVELE